MNEWDVVSEEDYKQNNEWDVVSETDYQPQQTKPQETGFIEDLRSASRERGEQFLNPSKEPSALGRFSPTLGAGLNAAGAMGGFAFDVAGAGIKQGLGALSSLASIDKSREYGLKSAKDIAGRAVESVSGFVKPIAEKVKEFDPGVYNDLGRIVDATGLSLVKPAAKILPDVISGGYKGVKGTGRALKLGVKETNALVDDIFYPNVEKAINKGTSGAGIIPKVSRGYEDIKQFRNSMQEVVPDIVKNKSNLSFLDKDGVLQKGVVPETVEEWSQVVKPRKDAIMESITGDLKKAGEEGATISNTAELSAINDIKKTDNYQAMMNHKEYDDVIKKLDEMEERYKSKPSVTPSEYNADITTLNTLVSSKADTLSDVFYIHLLQAKRKNLAEFMDKLGGQFQERKTLWGKYNDIESKVAQRANQLSKAPKNFGYWNMASLAEGIAGVTMGHPLMTASAAGTGVVAKLIQRAYDPNRAVKKMFERVERKINKSEGNIPPKPPIDPLAGDTSGAYRPPLRIEGGEWQSARPTPINTPPNEFMDVPFTATPQRQLRGYDQPLQLPAETFGNPNFTMPEGTPYLPQRVNPITLPEGSVPPQGLMEQGRVTQGNNLRSATQVANQSSPEAIKLQQMENIPSNPAKVEPKPTLQGTEAKAVETKLNEVAKAPVVEVTKPVVKETVKQEKVITPTKTDNKTVTTPKEQKIYVVDKADSLLSDSIKRFREETKSNAAGGGYNSWSDKDISDLLIKKNSNYPVIDDGSKTITINVPNDGKYNIQNNYGAFTTFYKNIKRMDTSPSKPPEFGTKLPSKKPTGKDPALIEKEAAEDFQKYLDVKNQVKNDYDNNVGKWNKDAQIEVDRWKKISDDVDNKKITLKSLSDEFYGRTPSYNDIQDKKLNVRGKLIDTNTQAEALKQRIKIEYPSMYREMFENSDIGLRNALKKIK